MKERILPMSVDMVYINSITEQAIHGFQGSAGKNGIVAVTVNSIDVIAFLKLSLYHQVILH